MITSAGIGSGIDIEGLITQLVTAEGQPEAQRLDRQEADYQAELSGLGLLKSALSSFQTSIADLEDLGNFQPRAASSSDDTVFTAVATSSSVAASYQIQVNAIAEAHKVRSAGVATSSTDVGSGTLTITIDGDSFDVVIASTSQTMDDIRDAINNASDNTGVNATIVNVDDGGGGTESRLVLTSTSTGTANDISVTVVDDDTNHTDTSGLSMLTSVNLTTLNASVDASIEVDGQTITRSANAISDAVDGVTLTLLKADAAVDKTLAVTLDTASVNASVLSFISAYNSMKSTFDQLSFFDPTTESAGILLADSTLRIVSGRISTELSKTVAAVGGTYDSLPSIGIESDADGNYVLDQTVFDEALATNFDDIGTLFADSTDGIAVKLDALLDEYLNTGGILESRTDGLKTSIESIDDSRELLSDRLIRIEARFRAEFTALDILVANFQATSNFLTQQLANLPGFSRENT